MIRSLAPCTITERSLFQTQTNYRTMETVITASGRPILACTTRQEAEDMIAYLNDRKPKPRVEALDERLVEGFTIAELFG
jgi:hypothetical protein